MYIGTQHQVFGTVVKCHLEHLPPGLSSGFTNSNPYGSPGLSSRLHLGPAQGGCRHLGTEASDKRPVYVCLFLLPPSLSFSSLSLPPSSLTYKKKKQKETKKCRSYMPHCRSWGIDIMLDTVRLFGGYFLSTCNVPETWLYVANTRKTRSLGDAKQLKVSKQTSQKEKETKLR